MMKALAQPSQCETFYLQNQLLTSTTQFLSALETVLKSKPPTYQPHLTKLTTKNVPGIKLRFQYIYLV